MYKSIPSIGSKGDSELTNDFFDSVLHERSCDLNQDTIQSLWIAYGINYRRLNQKGVPTVYFDTGWMIEQWSLFLAGPSFLVFGFLKPDPFSLWF